MPRFARPSPDVHESFVAAMQEFAAEGRGSPDDHSMIGHELRTYGKDWHRPERFADYVAALIENADEDHPRPADRVPCTTLWWVDGSAYVGRLAIRHRLTPALLDLGGHIGYDVRPTARRRGHATAMLRAALPMAHELGVDPALITCDADNTASQKVIEACGGVLEDARPHFRYWLPTG